MGHLAVQELLEDARRLRIGSAFAASYGSLSDAHPFAESRDIYVGKTSHAQFGAFSAHAVSADTFFDLASLTKILATTTLAMKRYEEGSFMLAESLIDSLPDAKMLNRTLSTIKIHELLTHTSGLPAWTPFYEEMKKRFGVNLPWLNLQTRKKAFDELLYLTPRETDAGKKIVYSDLGFLFLQNILSPHFQRDVESLWQAMGISKLHFRPVLTDALTARHFAEQSGLKIAATEICPWRGMLVGQVHDDNAWSMGGVAGHAGAFGRLKDVKDWINGVFLSGFISQKTLKRFTTEAVSVDGSRRALGFDMPNMDGSGSTGFSFSKHSVGHLGFTGTSLWIDLQSGDYAILLTNRVHPSRDELRIRPLRREFHRLVRALSK